MPKQININTNPTYGIGAQLTGYKSKAVTFEREIVEDYLRRCIPVVACSFDNDERIVTMTLACGDVITGITVGGE